MKFPKSMSITLAWSNEPGFAGGGGAPSQPVDLMAGAGASDPTAMPAEARAQAAAKKR